MISSKASFGSGFRFGVLALLAAAAAFTSAHADVASGGNLKVGTDYDVIEPALPTDSPPDKIELVELFAYWCPHCQAMEPLLTEWLKQPPPNVEFLRVPVVWGKSDSRLYAALYYTLRELNRLDLHRAVFEAVAYAKVSGGRRLDTFAAQQALAVELGIDAKEFAKAYKSKAVRDAVDRADATTRKFKVLSTPTFLIQGRYRTDSNKTQGDNVKLLSIVDELIEKARTPSAQ